MERLKSTAAAAVAAVVLVLSGCPRLDLLDEIEQRVADAARTAAPGIVVSSGGTAVAPGGSLDIGSAAVAAFKDVAFVINNSGDAPLVLSSTPVAITGTDPDEFAVSAAPSTTIAAGSSSGFTIRFSPLHVGTKTVTVTVANNSAAAPSYSIILTATATATPTPNMSVSQTSQITNGSTFTFPDTIRTQTIDRVFTISNNGTATLTLSPSMAISGTGFTLAAAPAGSVTAGGSTTFTVRFAPTATTTYSGSATIYSNDPTYPTFTFSLSGTGTEWHGTKAVDSTGVVGMYTSIGTTGTNVYVAYRDSTNGRLKVARSTDNSLNWSGSYAPDTTGAPQDTSMVIVGSDVYVAYSVAPSLLLLPKIVKGTGGTSWGSPITIDAGGGIDCSLSYDGSNWYLSYYNGIDVATHVNQSSNGTTWSMKDFSSFSRISGGYAACAVAGGSFFVGTYYNYNLYCDNYNFYNEPNPWISCTADGLSNDEGQHVSAAMAGSAAIFAYYDATPAAQNLKFAKVTRSYNGIAYVLSATNTTVYSTGNVGQYTSIATPDGGTTIYISFYDATNGDLKLAKSTNSGGAWTVSTVDSTGNVGQYTSIAVSGTTVHISYYDATNGDLKIAKSLDGGVTW